MEAACLPFERLVHTQFFLQTACVILQGSGFCDGQAVKFRSLLLSSSGLR